MSDAGIFAVLDVETTGFSPLIGDRVIEIAVIRLSADGSVHDEYATLVNPQRPVGPTELHGISQRDVEEAPTFEEIAGDVLERLEGLVVVGHNVRYDRDFLAAELSAAGIFLPSIPCLCTLKLAYRLHPEQTNHRLSTCCAALSLEHHPHDALEEARATVRLLGHYMEEAQESGVTMAEILEGEMRFPKSWPRIPPSGKIVTRPPREHPAPAVVPFLARVAAGRSGVVADEDVIQYVDLLDRALEDRRVTGTEARALEQTAKSWGLSEDQVHEAHEAYLRGVVEVAVTDRWITMAERQDLRAVVALLGLGPQALESMISEVAEDAH